MGEYWLLGHGITTAKVWRALIFIRAEPPSSYVVFPNIIGVAIVFVTNDNGANWIETFELQASDVLASDQFGWSVAVHGDMAAIGARLQDTNGGNAGKLSGLVDTYGTRIYVIRFVNARSDLYLRN